MAATHYQRPRLEPETYSIALAIQNLVWGASGLSLAGGLTDKGALKVIWTGGLLYALGLVGMALAASPLPSPWPPG